MSVARKIADLRGLEVVYSSKNNEKTGKLSVVHKNINNGTMIEDRPARAKLKKEIMENANHLSNEDKQAVKEVLGFDFQLALEMDRRDSVISNEYFDFIDQAHVIAQEFSDGEITQEDMNHKEEFLYHLDERQACMRRCLTLMGNSNHPKAQEMRLRWQRLLISRQAVLEVTKGKKVGDKPVDREYATKLMESVNKKLVSKEFNPFLRARLEMEISNSEAQIGKEIRKPSKESSREKLERLRGTLSKSSSPKQDKIININDRMQRNGFDLVRYNQMQKERI